MRITCPTICTSCQSPIGHIYIPFLRSKNNQLRNYEEQTGYKLTNSSSIESINMKDFLDKNNINNICCRKEILGHILITQDTID